MRGKPGPIGKPGPQGKRGKAGATGKAGPQGPRGEQATIIRPRYSVNTADAVIAGAAAGLGIAYLISYQAADSVRDGSLVTVLDDWAPAPFPVQIVHAPNPHLPLKLRAFLDFAAPRLQQRLRGVEAVFEGAEVPGA